jgi:hypothetical protein
MGLFGTWIKARGMVVARRVVRRGPHGIAIRHAYVVELQPSGEAPFRAEVKDPVFNGNFATPSEGKHVPVEYEAKSRKVRFDTSDPQLNYRAQRRAERDAEDARFRSKLDGK